MHSFVSSSAGSATLYPRRASRSGSITAFNQRRVSRISDHLRHLSTSHSMAATVAAASNVAGVSNEDKGDRAKLIQFEDPIAARTVTVDESFRRMEELVGAEEEDKNWKGVVIALVVIVFILAMIVTAIVLVTPDKPNIIAGDPFTFAQLTDPSLQPKQPVFHFHSVGDSYVTIIRNGTDEVIAQVDLTSTPDASKSPQVLIRSQLLKTLRDLRSVSLSPDGKYLLLELKSEEGEGSSYRIYNPADGKFKDDGHFNARTELDYVRWIGDRHELIFLKDNSILYSSGLNDPRTVYSSSKDNGTSNALPTRLYKDILRKDDLLWLSPGITRMKIAFAQIVQSTKTRSTRSAIRETVSLYVADLAMVKEDGNSGNNGKKLEAPDVDPDRLQYLTGVSWIDNDRLMAVWIDSSQQIATYLLCNVAMANCTENYVYKNKELKWVGIHQAPVFNRNLTEFYTILPNPAEQAMLYRHLVAIKLNPSERKDPKEQFLGTHHEWSDEIIVGMKDNVIYYISTGANYTHRHLYSYRLRDSKATCLTCQLDLGTKCLYVDATLSATGQWVLISCLGPHIPSHHVMSTQQLKNGTASSARQIGKKQRETITEVMKTVKTPIIEYFTLPLEGGFEASVKLYVPAVLDREKITTYGLIIIIGDGVAKQSATQEYPDLLTTYLCKNQSRLIANVDVGGSVHRGEKLRQSLYGRLGLKESHDLGQVIRYLNKTDHYKVNGSMIAVLGYGYGGFVALHSMRKSLVNCAIAVSPLTDMRNLNAFEFDHYMGGNIIKLQDTNLTYACKRGEDCSAPKQQKILLIHGTEDKKVDYSNSMDLMRKLQLAGYEFKQQMYPSVGHDIARSRVNKHFYQTMTNYLSECFSGSLDHDSLVSR